jgi:hypothetical protein
MLPLVEWGLLINHNKSISQKKFTFEQFHIHATTNPKKKEKKRRTTKPPPPTGKKKGKKKKPSKTPKE